MAGTFDRPFQHGKRKLNPDTLLSVLWEICRFQKFPTYPAAAEELNKKTAFSWNSRPLKFTRHVVRDFLRQKTVLKYWHLEAFARQAKVPTAFLLLLSRLRSNREKGYIDENARILATLRRIANSTRPDDEFTIAKLFEWADMLTEPNPKEEQLDMDL